MAVIMKNKVLSIASFILISSSTTMSFAADQDVKTALENDSLKSVASNCLGKWEQQPCLKSLSQASMKVTVDYAQRLKAKRFNGKVESLKQSCAASTAAIKQDVPAYALKSAMTECANEITDISSATGVQPNIDIYQLMIAGVLCLDKNPQCQSLEQRLAQLSQ